METLIKKLSLAVIILGSMQAIGQSSSGLIAPNRAINWSNAGAGPIPARSTICSTLGTAGQAPTFAQSVTSAQIVSALQSCPSGETVLLNPGTYTMATTLFGPGDGGATPSNVTLRGSGPQQTILVFNNATSFNNCSGIGSAAICIYNGDSGALGFASNTLQWTSGYSQGSTSITLGAAFTNPDGGGGSISNLHTGSLMVLDQCDQGFSGYPCSGTSTDNGNWWNCGVNGANACTWGGNDGAFPFAGQSQLVTVTGVSGNTVSFTPAIYAPNWSSAMSPFVWFSGSVPVNAFGIENLQINTQANTNSIASQVNMLWATSSWIKNVAFINNATLGQAARLHAVVQASSHVTVRDSYFYGGSPSSDDYAADFQWATADSLAENNIGQHISSSWMLEGAVGNIFGYNYAVDNFFGGGWQQCDLYHHNEGDIYDLMEGNEGICAIEDTAHGTADFLTYFRNYLSGFDPVTACPGGGLACYNSTGGTPPKNQNTLTFGDAAVNRYSNFLLNVLGNGTYQNTYQNVGAQGSPNSCPGYPWTVIYSLNFANANQQPFSPTCTGSSYIFDNDALTSQTLVRWGNYDTVTSTVRTNSGETGSGASVYPGLSSPSTSWASYPSLYLSSQPSWWVFPSGATAPWPGIGPEITGGNISNSGGHAYHNPAGNCYLNVLGGAVNGSSGPLPFDANICYANSTPTVATPTFSPVSGTYATTQNVAISTATAGATICFTTTGAAPMAPTAGTCGPSPTQTYSTPIVVSSTTQIRALGTLSGDLNSAITGGTWTISTPTLAVPTFSPDGNLTGDGYFLSNPTITITCPSGATCGYTTDGSTPTGSSGTITHGTTYSGPFALTITAAGVNLQAIATENLFLNSPVTSSTYFQRNIIVHNHSSFNGANTIQTSISTSVTASAGDGIECGVVFGSSIPTVTVSDNKNSGNYAVCVSPHFSSGTFASVGKFYMTNAAAGATVVTANFSQAVQYVGIGCRTLTPVVAGAFSCDPSGGPTPPSVDQSTANPTTGGATPVRANEYISCDLVTASGSATAGSGYFLGDVMPGGPNLFREYQIQSTAVSANCPFIAGAVATIDQQVGYHFNTGSSFSLSISTAGNGSGTITGCAGSYAPGASYSCTVTPATGSTLTSVTGCGGSGSTTYAGTMPSSNCTVTATFTLNTYNLTVTTNAGTGSGTVGPGCISGTYNYGTPISCTPAATSGSYFAGWTGGTCTGTTSPCNFTISGNATINALFNLLPPAPVNFHGAVSLSGGASIP